MTQLTPHFSLEEMIATQHRDIDNSPPPLVVSRLNLTAQALEQVRALLGSLPIHVNSGYRCPALNAAVGGVPDSAHLYGNAADFICPPFGAPLDICRAIAGANISFDQLIEEGTWTHLSIDPRMRKQILTKAPGGGYQVGLPA